MNKELIKSLEEILDTNNKEYLKQLTEAENDFYEYCKPGGVNNWQHPEKPPVQAGLAVVCKNFKPKRILDFGTGLTGFTFRKYAPEAESILVESSVTWLMKLRDYLDRKGLKSDNLFWFDDLQFNSLEACINLELQNWLLSHPLAIPLPLRRGDAGHENEIINVSSPLWSEPVKGYMITDTSQYSAPNSNIFDRVSSRTIRAYLDSRDQQSPKIHIILDQESKSPAQLGKFDFIHYDFGGMYIRTAYLRLAIDLLDRTKDSLIYIDDLHKKEFILENKKYEELVNEIIERRGGTWLDCGDSLTDFQGGRGGIVYFPPLEGEENEK